MKLLLFSGCKSRRNYKYFTGFSKYCSEGTAGPAAKTERCRKFVQNQYYLTWSFKCCVILHAEFTVELLFVSGGWKRKITEYFTRGKEEGNIHCYVHTQQNIILK